MKTYSQTQGSFWMGLLGWFAVSSAGAIAARLASGPDADADVQSEATVKKYMLGYGAAAATGLYLGLGRHVPDTWQSFFKWGGIGAALACVSVPVSNRLQKQDFKPLPAAPSAPGGQVSGIDMRRIKRFYGVK